MLPVVLKNYMKGNSYQVGLVEGKGIAIKLVKLADEQPAEERKAA